MDVRIGVTYSSAVLELDLGDADREAVTKDIDAALGSGGVLWLTDKKGRSVGVPADKIAYVELGSDMADRRVGFGAV